MTNVISSLLASYESGRVSRRHLVQALAALTAGSQAAPAATTPFQGVGINHIAVRVKDIPRSRDFYQKLLGLPLISESASSLFLRAGKNFLTFFKNDTPGLDHFCLAIENFRVGPVTEELKRLGLNPRQPANTDRVYFKDPDGLEVQLSANDHMA